MKISRRLFMRTSLQTGTGALLLHPSSLLSAVKPSGSSQSMPLARPTPDQIAWQNLEVGMFVHLAPNTWQNKESDDLSTPLSAIDPKQLNTDQWAQTAVNLGARYIVFVAKHQGGFCMWQTDTTDYSIKNTPWKHGKGDVLADVSASCRKFGLKLGVYCCPRDDHFGAATGGICKTPELQARYNAMYRQQLTEVWSRYGPLVEIWFDGSTITPVADLLRKYQPHAMVFQGPEATIRWVGNENGFAPYPCWNGISRQDARTGTATALDGDPNGSVWMPVEADVSIRRPDWFWSTTNGDKVMSQADLLSVYYRSVGRGAQLLLNIPPNRDGLLAQKDVGVASSFGKEIRRRFSQPLAAISGSDNQITLQLAKPTPIDTVVLQENTALGERVRRYQLQGLVGDTWRTIGDGSAIGHKRIQPVAPLTLTAVRLLITEAKGTPAIRNLAVFHTGVAPPADWQATAQLWAPNLAGLWKNHAFSLDLTKLIDRAAQYRVRFVPYTGAVTALSDVVLKLHGVTQPDLCKHLPSHPDQLLLDITGVDESVQLNGTVQGAAAGEIIVQKL
ncbi:MAG: alpha-L-fucosidase [Acidobacteriaceae bacterium]